MSIADFIKPQSGIPGFSPARMVSTNAETFVAMYDAVRANHNTDSSFRMVGDAYYERNKEIKNRFGRDIVAEIRKENPNAGAEYFVKELKKRADQLISEGRKTDAEAWNGIRTNQEVEEYAQQQAREANQRFHDVASRNPNGFTKQAAIFGGALAGGITDPLNLALLPFGAGAGRGIIKAAMIEGGLNAAAEAAAVPFVKEWQNELGYRYGFSDAVENIAMGAIGGAGLTGLIRGAVPAARATGHFFGSVSSYMLDKVANIKGVPQSVKSAASYLARVAHIDESTIPGTVKTSEDILAHRERLGKTAEEFESYRRPSEEPLRQESKLNQQAAISREIDGKIEDAIAKATESVEAKYIEKAQGIKESLKGVPNVNINKPSSMKKYLGYTPKSLAQFIKEAGGIREYSGELASRDITNKRMPGLIRKAKDGNNPALIPGMETADKQQTDYIKEAVFDAGYFPGKDDYNKITDSELWDAIADDVNGRKVYSADDMERIAIMEEQSSYVDDYARMGITEDMSDQEIAAILRDYDSQFDDMTDIASADNVPPLRRPEVEFSPPDSYTAKRAAFDEMMEKNPNLSVMMEDGVQISLKELAERMGQDLNAIEAITQCRLA